MITAEDVLAIRHIVWPDGKIDPAEADAIFDLNSALKDSPREWVDFFVEAIDTYVVHQQAPVGYVDDAKANWLISRIDSDGRIDSLGELELLVKILEDSLGVPLFRRLPRGVVVTEAGGRYLARVGTLLDQLDEATVDLQRLETSRVLTVSAMPSMVSCWLIPRLGRLTERYPELDVRIVAKVPRTDFAREEIDVAIRTGPGADDGEAGMAPIYDRRCLGAGARIEGPAIVRQLDSTTVLFPGQTAEVHSYGSMIVRET